MQYLHIISKLLLFNDSSGVNLLVENNVMKKSTGIALAGIKEVAPASNKHRGK
jgi:hypothetical protein